MKIYLFVIILFLSLAVKGQSKDHRSIGIYSVNFFASTITSINCDSFFSQFEGWIDTSVCYSRDSIIILDNFLDNIKYAAENTPLNTRAKILFVTKSGRKVSICIDMFQVAVNDKLIVDYPDFFKYLRALIPKKQFLRKIPGN